MFLARELRGWFVEWVVQHTTPYCRRQGKICFLPPMAPNKTWGPSRDDDRQIIHRSRGQNCLSAALYVRTYVLHRAWRAERKETQKGKQWSSMYNSSCAAQYKRLSWKFYFFKNGRGTKLLLEPVHERSYSDTKKQRVSQKMALYSQFVPSTNVPVDSHFPPRGIHVG